MHTLKVKRLFQLTNKLKRDGTMGIHKDINNFHFSEKQFDQSQVGE